MSAIQPVSLNTYKKILTDPIIQDKPEESSSAFDLEGLVDSDLEPIEEDYDLWEDDDATPSKTTISLLNEVKKTDKFDLGRFKEIYEETDKNELSAINSHK